MADPIRELLSQTSYNTDGVTTVWDFSFAGGYLDKAHVKVQSLDPATGTVTQIPITLANFIGPYQLSLTPALAAGAELTIYRDTPKDEPLVNFADKASLTETSLDLNAKQAIFVAAEGSDGLATAIDSVSEIANQVQNASDFADDAGASAAAAAASEGTASTQAGIATAQAVAAAASAVDAQSSEDATAAMLASLAGGPVVSVAGQTGIVSAAQLRTGLNILAFGQQVDATATGDAHTLLLSPFMPPVMQCRLVYVSGTAVRLQRHNGRFITIDGVYREIPSAGVTLANTSLVTGTTYNVYASWNGTAIVLNAEGIARTLDTARGYYVKTGDVAKTLVGKVYITTGNLFTQAADVLGVLSFYNRMPWALTKGLGSTPANSTTPAELSSALRTYFLSWGDEYIRSDVYAVINPAAANIVWFNRSSIAYPGGAASGDSGYFQGYTAGAFGAALQYLQVLPAENLGSGAIPVSLSFAAMDIWSNSAGTATISASTIRTTLTC